MLGWNSRAAAGLVQEHRHELRDRGEALEHPLDDNVPLEALVPELLARKNSAMPPSASLVSTGTCRPWRTSQMSRARWAAGRGRAGGMGGLPGSVLAREPL
jgi:hypothetical protein